MTNWLRRRRVGVNARSSEAIARRKNSRETKALRVGPAEERVKRDVADKVVRILGASFPTLESVQEGGQLYP